MYVGLRCFVNSRGVFANWNLQKHESEFKTLIFHPFSLFLSKDSLQLNERGVRHHARLMKSIVTFLVSVLTGLLAGIWPMNAATDA